MVTGLRRGILCSAIFAVTLSPPAIAAKQTQSATDGRATAANDAGNLPLATALIDLVHPDDLMLKQNLEGWEIGLRASIQANPALARLESSAPGLTEAALSAGRPTATKYLISAIRKMKSQKAQLTASQLSESELKAAYEFYSSGAGSRMLQRFSANADIKAFSDGVLKRREETGEMEITEADTRRATVKAEKAAIGDASSDDILAMMKFEQTSAAQKLADVGAQSDKFMLDMMNSPDPEWIRQQNEIVSGAIIRHVESVQKAAR